MKDWLESHYDIKDSQYGLFSHVVNGKAVIVIAFLWDETREGTRHAVGVGVVSGQGWGKAGQKDDVRCIDLLSHSLPQNY